MLRRDKHPTMNASTDSDNEESKMLHDVNDLLARWAAKTNPKADLSEEEKQAKEREFARVKQIEDAAVEKARQEMSMKREQLERDKIELEEANNAIEAKRNEVLKKKQEFEAEALESQSQKEALEQERKIMLDLKKAMKKKVLQASNQQERLEQERLELQELKETMEVTKSKALEASAQQQERFEREWARMQGMREALDAKAEEISNQQHLRFEREWAKIQQMKSAMEQKEMETMKQQEQLEREKTEFEKMSRSVEVGKKERLDLIMEEIIECDEKELSSQSNLMRTKNMHVKGLKKTNGVKKPRKLQKEKEINEGNVLTSGVNVLHREMKDETMKSIEIEKGLKIRVEVADSKVDMDQKEKNISVDNGGPDVKKEDELCIVDTPTEDILHKEEEELAEVLSSDKEAQQRLDQLNCVKEDLPRQIKRKDEDVKQTKEENGVDSKVEKDLEEVKDSRLSENHSDELGKTVQEEKKGGNKEDQPLMEKLPTILEDQNVNVDSVHPILGPLVSDLGYKRIHLSSSSKLVKIPIWKKQRSYQHNRAIAMAADKAKTMHLGFPGVICLYEDALGGLFVLDGQHRLGMMHVLQDMKRSNERRKSNLSNIDDNVLFERVLVEVYPEPYEKTGQTNCTNTAKGDQYAEEVYFEINKAESLPYIDFPGVATASERKIILEAVALLQKKFPKMFSPSQRCRMPNVNENNLRDQIFGANILKKPLFAGKGFDKRPLKSSKELAYWLEAQNTALGELYKTDQIKQIFVHERAWKKAVENKFYLGLDSSWLYIDLA